MSNQEQHEYLCGILAKLVDSCLTANELRDLASALGINVDEFYKPLDVIDWRKAA